MSVDTAAVNSPALVRALLAQDPAAVQAALARATLLVPVSPAGDGHGGFSAGAPAGAGRCFGHSPTPKRYGPGIAARSAAPSRSMPRRWPGWPTLPTRSSP